MSRWFRVYDDMVDDPKVQRLPDASFKALVNLWCLASNNGGKLPSIDDIAFKLRMKPERVAALIFGLTNAGLIDEVDDELRPHNWDKRQFKSDVSNERVKRHRERQCNVTDAVTVTPPDTEADNRTESEKERTRAVALPSADDWPSDFRDRFWTKYPNKVGKPDALKKLERARSGGVPWAELWGGLERYVAKTDDRPWCNPATWINQQRWTDQPAQQIPSKGPAHVAENRSLVAAARKAAERFGGAPKLGDGPGEPVLRLISESGR